MFVWIKKLFSKKKVSLPGPEPHSEDLLKKQETKEEEYEIEEEQRITKTVKEEPKKDVERPQKSCPHCGAENDEFSHICWLCKKEI